MQIKNLPPQPVLPVLLAAHTLQMGGHKTYATVDIADGDLAAHLGHVGLGDKKCLTSVAVGAAFERRWASVFEVLERRPDS